MPLFSFLEFQDINFTSAEQRRDIWKLNPSSPCHRWGTPGCPRGVETAEEFTEGGLAMCREHRFTLARTGYESRVICSFLHWFMHWIFTEPCAFCVPRAGHMDCFTNYQLTPSCMSLNLPTPWFPHLYCIIELIIKFKTQSGFQED